MAVTSEISIIADHVSIVHLLSFRGRQADAHSVSQALKIAVATRDPAVS